MSALYIVPDDNDYCFVEIPVSSTTPTVIERTERYKYDGTNWGYEYTLNNSGFTSQQWDAINSGITSGKVSTYDTIAGYFSGGKILSTALPAMYIGKTAVQFTSATQDLTGIGNVTMDNAKALKWLYSGNEVVGMQLNSSGHIYVGSGLPAISKTLYMNGYAFRVFTGSDPTEAFYIASNQSAYFYGHLDISNAKHIYMKDKVESGTAHDVSVLTLDSSNVLKLGGGLINTTGARAYNTYIYGASVSFYTGSSTTGATRKWMINSSGSLYPYTPNAYNLGTSSYYIKEAYISKIFLAANTYLEVDSNGYVHLVTPSGKGFYCDGFISAGGLSTGGGSTGIDALAMWKLLTNNDSLTTYDNNTKIAVAHIPDVASTYGYLKSEDISDMATKT